MENARSHADFVTGAVFLRVGGTDAEGRSLVEAARASPGSDYKKAVLRYALTQYRGIFAHEWAHVLQVASYPYLLLRAARQGRMMVAVGTYLNQNPGHHRLPLQFALQERWMMSNVLSEAPVKVTVGEDFVDMKVVTDPSRHRRGTLTELDIIEEDAQIFQYRVEIGSRGNGKAYRRWLLEQSRYSLAFNILARHIGDNAAYRALPLLVRTAFKTTRPMHAFFKGFGVLVRNGAEYLSDWNTHDVMARILLDIIARDIGTIDLDGLHFLRPELADPQGVIPPEGLATVLDQARHLPVAPLTDLHLNGGTGEGGTITRVLAAPWEFFPRHEEHADLPMQFLPPGIVVRLIGDDFPRGATVLSIAPLLLQSPFPPIPGVTYAEWFRQVFRLRALWKSIFAGASGPNPFCPHTGCRVHMTGLCHGWFPVPKVASDCQFPPFFLATTKHDISADGTELVPLSSPAVTT